MNADEYLKRVTPAVKVSKLASLKGELLKLLEAGCTLRQLHEFATLNEIQISYSGLVKYMQRNTATKSRIRATPPMPEKETRNETQTAPIQSSNKATTEIGENKIPENRSHDPAFLDAIMRSTPDLDALAKAYKKEKNK
jgi:hypothetical protein